MKQMFGSDNHYVQDEGCGHVLIICALWPVNSGENSGSFRKIVKRRGKLTVKKLGGPHTVVLTLHAVLTSSGGGRDSRNGGANICPPLSSPL